LTPNVSLANVYGRIKKWVAHELGISPSDAAELMLQVTGTDKRPDPDTNIGALAKASAKALSFDLVPSPCING
jgi:hypothetical protein